MLYYGIVRRCVEIHSFTVTFLILLATVISEPDDAIICEGRSTTFPCVLNSNINSDDVQWYRLMMDTSTTVLVDPDDDQSITISTRTGSTLTSSLTITNAVKSYTGYYWVRLPSDDVCNVSLTVFGTSMWIQSKCITTKLTTCITSCYNKIVATSFYF